MMITVSIPDSIYIKGIEINLKDLTNKDADLQTFMQGTMNTLFKNNLIPNEEIKLLKDNSYSKLTFGMPFPLISTTAPIPGDDHPRYYKDPVYSNYYLCNEWRNLTSQTLVELAQKQREQVYAWLVRLAAMQ